jgi:lysozyme family protein
VANHRLVLPLIRKVEGGLSRAKTDSARFDPVPDGSGYHTNRGVTWATFKGLSARLGYAATPALFYQMPPAIWERIFKLGYWDAVAGDALKSQGVATVAVDYAWGAGPGTAVKAMQQVLNYQYGARLVVDGRMGAATLRAANSVPEAGFLAALAAHQKAHYLSLPNQSANYAGWAKRLAEVEAFAKKRLPAGAA